MAFNSFTFIFGYLPAVLAIFFLFGRLGWCRLAAAWLCVASLAFYGWNEPVRLLPLIIGSIVFNYAIGRWLMRSQGGAVLAVGVGGNLLFLGVFKYATFFLQTLSAVTGLAVPDITVELPIGISFYTFTQIAFLVDAYRREAREYRPVHYGLFVTFFPHLVAGPILHHREMMPQFEQPETYRPRADDLALGLSWFAAGLFKKVVLADGIAGYAVPAFAAAADGHAVSLAAAWIGVLGFSLQLYFDFSGYSDMAIGLARIMGIRLPVNFNSPYKAASLVEFWRRWHMTLSRFLRDYLYVPLGGNRRGPARRYANLLATMALGGLWHGASWNFVVWGALHGAGLLLNHAWRALSGKLGPAMPAAIGQMLTLALVVFAWVPFRADTLAATVSIWKSMVGVNGLMTADADAGRALTWIVVLSGIALFAPNTQEMFAGHRIADAARRPSGAARLPSVGTRRDGRLARIPGWTPNLVWAVTLGTALGIAVAGLIQKPTVFLYFQF